MEATTEQLKWMCETMLEIRVCEETMVKVYQEGYPYELVAGF